MPKIPEKKVKTMEPVDTSKLILSLFFNEIKPYPAHWLRNLWPNANVEEKSIADLTGKNLLSYDRVHFFAGIGGWEYDTDGNECGSTGRKPSVQDNGQYDGTQYSDWWRTTESERASIDKPWNRSIWVECSDSKRRRVPSLEQGVCPLAPRVSTTVEQISAYGNAIVPQVAALFIRSFLEAIAD